MPYYAVSATSYRHNPYVAFSGALVENWSELGMPNQMWPQLVTPHYNRTFSMIKDHFWPPSRLPGTLTLIWSNLKEHDEAAQKKWYRDKYGPNPCYLGTVTNTGPLYATWELIWPILSQSAVHAVTWYTRSRSLNSALKWTISFKLDILDNSWPPFPITANTGPVDAILCSICH